MASPVYNNKSLGKPMSGPNKSRTYTNKDLIGADDFQEDDFTPDPKPNLAADDFTPDDDRPAPTVVPDSAPGTWMGGFLNSFRPGGDVEQSTNRNLRGYLEDAINIPKTVIGGIKSAYQGIKDGYNFNAKDMPVLSREELGAQLNNKTPMGNPLDSMDYGSNDSFGRMMGQMTGQPLVTAGLIKGAPSAIRGAGAVLDKTGGIVAKHAPISATIPSILEPRIARIMESAVGRGVQNVGQKMRGFRKKDPISDIDPFMPNKSGFKPGTSNMNEPMDFGPSPVEPLMPNQSGFRPGANNLNEPLDFGPSPVEPMMPNRSGYRANPNLEANNPLDFEVPQIDPYMPNESSFMGNPITEAPGAISEGFLNPKPTFRRLPDGNFVNLGTGEVVNPTGKPMAAPATAPKPSYRRLPDGNFLRLDTNEIVNAAGKPMAHPMVENPNFLEEYARPITKESDFFKKYRKH